MQLQNWKLDLNNSNKQSNIILKRKSNEALPSSLNLFDTTAIPECKYFTAESKLHLSFGNGKKSQLFSSNNSIECLDGNLQKIIFEEMEYTTVHNIY
jgi:hypothetical protein